MTGNLIRSCKVGVMLTSDPKAGPCLTAQNVISGASGGAIRTALFGNLEGPDLANEATLNPRLAISGNLSA